MTIPHKNSIHKYGELKEIRIFSKKPAKESIEIINKAIEQNLPNTDSTRIQNLVDALKQKAIDYSNVPYQESKIKEINSSFFDSAIEFVKKW
jgi:hypothetical protein